MSNKLYVGNIPYSTTNEDLNELFSEYGTVTEVKIITDRATNRSKGFGFVTFEDANACNSAIEALNGYELDGRNIKVNVAKERQGRGKNFSNQRNNRPRY